MSEHKEPIPSMIYNASVGGHVTNSQQIIDENENKEQSQINAEVKQNLGQGGSVDTRINQAKTDIIGGASSDGNTLKKIEDRVSPLESSVGSGGSVDTRISNAVAVETTRAQAAEADRYTKSETYTKAEVNGLVDTPHQEYVTVATYASLPALGSKDTIYRVSNYDGSQSQVDNTVYSEYAWDGTQYVFLCVKSQIGEVFDISVYNNNAKYADLAAALNGGANIPQSLQKGGMSVKFVQSSNNIYVQYHCTSNEFTTDVTQWQKEFNERKTFNLSFTTGSLVRMRDLSVGDTYTLDIVKFSGYQYIIDSCKAGDIYIANTHGVTDVAKSYCILDKNNVVLALGTSNLVDAKITIPANGCIMIINSSIESDVYAKKSIDLIENIEGEISDLNSATFGKNYVPDKSIKDGVEKNDSGWLITSKVAVKKGDVVTWNNGMASDGVTYRYIDIFDEFGQLLNQYSNTTNGRQIEIIADAAAYIQASMFNTAGIFILVNSVVLWTKNDKFDLLAAYKEFVNPQLSELNDDVIGKGNERYMGEKICLEQKNNKILTKVVVKDFTAADYSSWQFYLTQSATLFGNYFFIAYQDVNGGNSDIVVIDRTTLEPLSRFNYGVSDSHANSIQFIDEYYDSNDEFPLCLVSTENNGRIDVVRISRSGNIFSGQRVATVTMAGPNTCWAYDNETKILTGYWYKNGTYNIDKATNSINFVQFYVASFKESIVLDFSDGKVLYTNHWCVGQGIFAKDGKLYFYNTSENEGGVEFNNIPVGIWVINETNGVVESIIPIPRDMEAEGIAYEDSDIYTFDRRPSNDSVHLRITKRTV